MLYKFSVSSLLPVVFAATVLFGCGGTGGDAAGSAPVARDGFAAEVVTVAAIGKQAATVIPTTPEWWSTVYDGYGGVTYDAAAGVSLAPMAATQSGETHAALTLARLPALRNFRLTLTAITIEQLRRNAPPNPWEVLWIVFNYNPSAYGKDTNYFLLKPNGVELGTASGQTGQTFLQTNPTGATAVGVANLIDIEKSANRVRVRINGVRVIDYAGAVLDVPGSIGIYAEDARVQATNIELVPLP